jgi:hypothetical protein
MQSGGNMSGIAREVQLAAAGLVDIAGTWVAALFLIKTS